MTPLHEVLDLARWAPSGDNTQPWRFAVQGPDKVRVLGSDTREHCVYDLDGHPSQISHGALLETMAIAATRFGWRAQAKRLTDAPETHPAYDVTFAPAPLVQEDPLVRQIEARRVQRRALRTTPLTAPEKSVLEQAVAPRYRIAWFAGTRERVAIARLNSASARIRLTIPEAYEVHRSVIEWGAELSEDRIPSAALGASAGTLRVMRWALTSWGRVDFMNRYLAGTMLPRIELDLVPGVACAAHAFLIAEQMPAGIDDYVAAGRALQRFWLTASALGLQFQPQYTPLIFSRYVREGIAFASSAAARRAAQAVARRVDTLLGPDVAARAVFAGRIGHGAPAAARSTRLPLDRLMLAGAAERTA